MKIAVTVNDVAPAYLGGGEIERKSYIIDIPDECVPAAVFTAIAEKAKPEPDPYLTMSLSFVV